MTIAFEGLAFVSTGLSTLDWDEVRSITANETVFRQIGSIF
jgi:hypothetical protein